jgi:hypothetical protein
VVAVKKNNLYVKKYNKSDNLDDFYDDGPPSPFSKDNPQKADPIDAEVDNYLHRSSYTFAAQFDKCPQFWRQKSKDLPRLVVLAKRLLLSCSSTSQRKSLGPINRSKFSDYEKFKKNSAPIPLKLFLFAFMINMIK